MKSIRMLNAEKNFNIAPLIGLNPLAVFSLAIFLVLNGSAEAACPAPGTGIVVNGTTATESGCTITTAGTPANQANLAGIINLSSSTISTTGGGAYGAFANGVGSTINLSNVSITTASANALFLNSGEILFNTGSILTTGGSTNGAQLLGTGSILTLDNVNVQVDGTAGVGLLVQLGGNTVNATNCTITTTANGGVGVDVGLGGGAASSVSLDNCILNVPQGVGPPSFGAVVARNGSSVDVQDCTINTEVYGVHSIGAGASIIVDNSTINVTANAAVFGAYAQNSTTITLQNNTSVTTTGGNNAHGFVIQDGSTGNLFDSSIETSGTNAQGIFMIGFSAGNQANVSDSTVTTSGTGASAIQFFANAGITNTVQATNTTFSAANEDMFVVGGGIANMTFDRVSADASPGHLLLLVDGSNPATLTWTADSSDLSGDMQVVAGNTGNVTLENSRWSGAALDVTSLAVNSSVWNVTGNSTLGSLSNSGLIHFNAPPFKTISTTNYTGGGGTIEFNTFLGDDSSPSDLLIINGGTATGSTGVIIMNAGGPGAETTGNGILIVNAINGGTTNPNAFQLAARVEEGPYEYELFRGSVDGTNPEAWYLRSEIFFDGDLVPNYRPETSLYAALPSMALFYGLRLVDTFHERMGEQRPFGRGDQKMNQDSLVWTRFIYEHGDEEGSSNGIFGNGPKYDYNVYSLQLGIDLYHRLHDNNSSDSVGTYAAIGEVSGHVDHFDHSDAGKNRIDIGTIGTYWTHYGPSGWYLDTVAQGSYYYVKAIPHEISSFKTHGFGFSGSMEGGYPLQLGASFILEPQIQLIYQFIDFSNASDDGAKIHFNDIDSLTGRLGLRLARSWTFRDRIATVWIRASGWDEFLGNPKTSFSSQSGFIPFLAKIDGAWAEFNLGFDTQITQLFSLYASGGYQTNFGHDTAYDAEAGLKFRW